MRASSTACDAARRLVAISLLSSSGGRFSGSSPLMELTRRRIRSVSSFSGLDSKASVRQRLNWVRMRRAWEWARYPLSVSLFILQMRCSILIWVALSLIDERPRPISLAGLCTPSVGQLKRRPGACLSAPLSMPSISVSCRSLKTPRYVARYFDLRSCLITSVFSLSSVFVS